MLSNYTLREITVADGPAINTLAANCPDAGLISVYSVFRDNAWQSLQVLRSDTAGVLAEAPGHAGLAGMGLVSFATCGIQGAVVSCALLNTLMVHQDNDANRCEDAHPHLGRSTDLSHPLKRKIWQV